MRDGVQPYSRSRGHTAAHLALQDRLCRQGHQLTRQLILIGSPRPARCRTGLHVDPSPEVRGVVARDSRQTSL